MKEDTLCKDGSLMFEIGEAMRLLKRNPRIFGFFSAGTLVFYLLMLLNPYESVVLDVVGSLTGKGMLIKDFLSFFDTFLSAIQIFLNLRNVTFIGWIAVIVIWFTAPLIFSLFFSFFLPSVKRLILFGGWRIRDCFSDGKYLIWKLYWVFFLLLPIGLMFFFFLGVSMLPALIMSEYAVMKEGALAMPVLVFGILTFGMVIFILILVQLYVMMWFPSVLLDGGRILFAFRRGKYLADRDLSVMLGELAIMDLAYLMIQSIIFLFQYLISGTVRMEGISYGGILFFIINWLLKTGFLSLLVIYTFQRYYRLKAFGAAKAKKV